MSRSYSFSQKIVNFQFKDRLLLAMIVYFTCDTKMVVISQKLSENRTKYVFKGDDDTLVNPFELKKLIDTDLERQSKLKEKEASIYGSLLETQPVERHSTKYGDNLWPSKDYPTYVSGKFQNNILHHWRTALSGFTVRFLSVKIWNFQSGGFLCPDFEFELDFDRQTPHSNSE